MGWTAGGWKSATAFCLCIIFCGAGICRAEDCGPTAYAYEDRLVVYTCGKGGRPELQLIVLNDDSAVKATGSVKLTAQRSFDAAMNHNNLLVLLTWDNLEIFDLSEPTHPTLAAKLQLKDQARLRGYPRIERTAVNKFLVIATVGVTEVTAEGQPAKWALKDLPATPEIQKKMSSRPAESRFYLEMDSTAVVLRETPKFRYELVWKDKARPGQVIHGQYVQQIDKSTQQIASELALGRRLETID